MNYYDKNTINQLKRRDDSYIIPNLLFDGGKYNNVRLEVKWAYVACLNVLIHSPLYDKEGKAYFKDNNPMLIETLEKLANKAVDKEKMQGYLKELEENDLLSISSRNVYLYKVEE